MTFLDKPNSGADWELVEDGDGNPGFDWSCDKFPEDITMVGIHLVLEGCDDNIPYVWTYFFESRTLMRLEFNDAAYIIGLSTNYKVNLGWCRQSCDWVQLDAHSFVDCWDINSK